MRIQNINYNQNFQARLRIFGDLDAINNKQLSEIKDITDTIGDYVDIINIDIGKCQYMLARVHGIIPSYEEKPSSSCRKVIINSRINLEDYSKTFTCKHQSLVSEEQLTLPLEEMKEYLRTLAKKFPAKSSD